MVLPEAALFPHALVPLFIFEKRYRAMLSWALERDRMFCLAMMLPGLTEAVDPGDFHHVAGIGMVRACVEHEDGTSHLVLQGIARVRFTGFIEEKPFRMAHLAPFLERPADSRTAEELSTQVLGWCARFRAAGAEVPVDVDAQLAKVTDPAMLGDIVAHTFIRDAQRRQELLEETDVEERLRILLRQLEVELG